MKAWRPFKGAPARLAARIAAGLLDLARMRVRTFALAALAAAMDAAAAMRGLALTALAMD